MKVASASTVMLQMFSASSPMVSGWSEPLLRSILPVMVSVLVLLSMVKPLNTPPVTVPPRSFTVASVKSPSVMEPPL